MKGFFAVIAAIPLCSGSAVAVFYKIIPVTARADYFDILFHRIMIYMMINVKSINLTHYPKNGHSENGKQRYRCNNCKKSFQTEYRYNAWQPGVKDQTETQT
ncbi:MAG: hypothetical protein AB7S75_21805, partial [Desulfococcaceae bacterium]